MKTKIIPSRWLADSGRRLDPGPYLSGAIEAKETLRALKVKKVALSELTKGFNGGIFNGPQFSRNYVASAEHGVPFLGSSSMLLADLAHLPWLRRKDAESSKLRHLRVEEGMTLISCSGTVGRMVFARPDMAGMWSSQDIMKVVPDPDKIPPGYLYAFLSSRFGVPMVTSGTYGAIIQHIEPEHLYSITVPRLAERTEGEIANLVDRASRLRAAALDKLAQARTHCFSLLGADRPLELPSPSTAIVSSSQLNRRFDATFHTAEVYAIEKLLHRSRVPIKRLADVTERLFKPPIFKRRWVDSAEHGVEFVSGTDAYRWCSSDPRFVSRKSANFSEFLLKKGWVVFQAAGQTYGLFGRPLFVQGWLEGLFCADDMFRIVANDSVDGAYIYSWFATEMGRALIVRQACGYSIPRVWEPHVSQLIIPWPERNERENIARIVIAAHKEIDDALMLERESTRRVELALEQ